MTNKHISFKVDGKTLKTQQGESVLKACYTAYVDIPRFCYHEGLRIAGNCRMCLVEVANSRKLIASCATPLISSFSIFTKTFRVKRARQAVLEFLLINHPLDCPICDQGGECDLQDITLVFGGDRGRFYEMSKRAVFDKNLGPLIKTSMNRCIHCTRCVRFFQETSFFETDRLGLLGRGSSTEIGTYMPNFMLSELSGNVIDLCPVGALTSKPFAFKARTWELYSQYTYDCIDTFMPRVKFDLVGKNVLRVLPYMGVYNFGWIHNKTRFCYDALNLQRQDTCLWNFSSKLTGFFSRFVSQKSFKEVYISITWEDAFSILTGFFLSNFKKNIYSFTSSLGALEYIWQIKQFFISMGNHYITFEDLPFTGDKNVDFRRNFSLDFSLEVLTNQLWHVFLMNVNLRMEAPLLFLQFKKLLIKGNLNIFSIGSNFLPYDRNINTQIGISIRDFVKMLENRMSFTRLLLKRAAFYKVLILTNIEFLQKHNIRFIDLMFEQFCGALSYVGHNNIPMKSYFQSTISNFNDESPIVFSVLQRYVGYLSSAELALFLTPSFVFDDKNKQKNSGLNVFFDTSNRLHNKYINKEFSTNVLFTSTSLELLETRNIFSLVFPIKGIYEVDLTFLDIFLKKKKVALILSQDHTRKNLTEVLQALSIYMRFLLKNNWICFFILSFYKNIKPYLGNIIYDHIIAFENNGVAFYDMDKLNSKRKNLSFFLFSLHFNFHKNFEKNNSYAFLYLNTINILPLLNFYDDNRINLISLSKSMKQSSIAYEQSYVDLSFNI